MTRHELRELRTDLRNAKQWVLTQKEKRAVDREIDSVSRELRATYLPGNKSR